MPLHDHFHPPWSSRRPWEGFHGAWATAIAFHLNTSGLLPAEYFAMPLQEISSGVEVDVGTFQEQGPVNGSNVAVWAPPRPAITLTLDPTAADTFEVQVLRDFGGPKLRAAIELASPSNKDRPASRRAFAVKCAGYLLRGVSVIIVDIVSERRANLHRELLQELGRGQEPVWESLTHLYAVTYRSTGTAEAPRLEMWPEALTLGAALPELPLWLEPDLSVPLRLEESYQVTCGSLRMGS